MFCGCKSLKDIFLSNFNTKNVKKMTCMFSDCPKEFIVKVKESNNNFNYEAFSKEDKDDIDFNLIGIA